ncbi:capsule assembly Wzi family protein [Rheinheimera riviphila]|uniref:Capsule assembly Wzi family protein n=1 Tax=Rheinheimera riviphila TaxID=1834037 RepID=A0A437R592_9GAMM|nr:capsule assembly Wzi family protein [Rheinheimera riviphila]RVU41837.1 capsule assembly Wzi family protein [Rheinheimera riviphila]
MKKLAALCLLSLAPTAFATPWLDTSDNYLRQSLQTLAQAGLLTGPINTYPIMWKNIAIDLNKIDVNQVEPQLRFAVLHLKSALDTNRATHSRGVKLSYNSHDTHVQSFGEQYFEKAAITLFNEVQGDNWAGRLQLTYRDEFATATPITGVTAESQKLVADGSYVAGIWGNWVLALDQDSVWWGPGQQSSLLLSNNARPIAAVRLSRHSWQADTRPWLQWLGPWNITTFVGQDAEMEKLFSSDEPNNTKYWGGRATIRPWPAVELGLSRVIQWGGTGRSNSFTTLWDLVSYDKTDEIPADQRAALDLSYHLQAFGWPLTAYAEIADDDNQSGLPDKALSLFGVRSYWGEQNAIHTLNLEYSDTFLDCENSLQRGNCAYQGEVFPQGYRRFERVIGSGYGADARVLSAGYQYQTLGGISWSGHLYRAAFYDEKLPGQLASDAVWQLKMEHRRPMMKGLLSIQLRLAEKSDFRPEFDQSFSVAGSWEYRY